MKSIIQKLLRESSGYYGHVLTQNLPKELDNRLYTLLHMLGGMNFMDVIKFGEKASEDEINILTTKVMQFPSEQHEILRNAGGYEILKDSSAYQEIVDLIKSIAYRDTIDESLDDLKYAEEPKEKHVRRMNRDLGQLHGFPIQVFKNIPPPKNESETTEEEIVHLDSIPVDEKFVKNADETEEYFEKFLKTKGLEYPKEDIKIYLPGVRSIILQLKYYYNRPRPGQVADAKGMDFDPESLKSASTPSYPSGHATQGRFIARYLSDLYPEYEKDLMKIGDDIAYSRNMAKVHYPSDSVFGKELGDSLYQYIIKNQPLNEDVQYDKEGYPTNDTNPYVLRYITPKTKKALFKHWDSLGNMEWSSLKLFGIEGEDEAFDNIADVLYPLLAIEWLGGVENTPLAKEDWMDIRRGRQTRIRYKIIPLRFDYLFDESERFGEHGYSCYDIKVVIDWGTPGPEELQMLEELVPKDKRNKLMSYSNYDENTLELIEQLWETTEHIRGDVGVMQFCRLEIEVVNP